MTLARIGTAAQVINKAALEIGLTPQIDPFSSPDDSFRQLVAFLNTCGDELAGVYPWEFLTKQHQIVTVNDPDALPDPIVDTGDYPLPSDFLFMINQSGWERANRVPLFGPLSSQDWTYLEGRRLASNTIYASFRLREGLFSIYPQPPPNGLDINFEYISKNWVIDNSVDPAVETDEATQASDTVLFDRILISRFIKVKYLEAKGLDSTKAQDDFYAQFQFITNVDKGGEIIRAGGHGRGFPYLDTYRNTPDTSYGRGFI